MNKNISMIRIYFVCNYYNMFTIINLKLLSIYVLFYKDDA